MDLTINRFNDFQVKTNLVIYRFEPILNQFTDKPIYQFQNQNRFNEYRFKQIYRFTNLMIRFDLTISNRFKRFDLKKSLNDLMKKQFNDYRFNDFISI